METLRLYRGDYRKITEFDFHKTNKYCYVGPGVYLTDSLKVAETYRTKGSSERPRVSLLFSGSAKDRTMALEKAFAAFMEEKCREQGVRFTRDSNTKAWHRIGEEARAEFQRLVDAKKIVAEYTSTGYQLRERALDVTYYRDDKVGYITEFLFPRAAFLSSVVNIDERIVDRMFWEIVHDAGQVYGTPYSNRDDFIRANMMKKFERQTTRSVNGRLVLSGRHDRHVFTTLRRILKPYGYRGFEYNGGVHVGGFGRHRAFCIWDDDFVNEHRVKRFR